MEGFIISDSEGNKGRSLIATRSFSANEVIFSESPIICCQFSWNRFYGYLACDHCMRPLETAETNARRLSGILNVSLPQFINSPFSSIDIVNCDKCAIPYCSERCKMEALSTYHSFTCPALCTSSIDNPFSRLDEMWRNIHYPPETGSIMLLIRIVAIHFSQFINSDAKTQEAIRALDTLISTTSSQITSSESITTLNHKLLGPEYANQIKKIHACLIDVLKELSSRVGRQDTFFDFIREIKLGGLLTIEGFQTAFCLIARNGQGIATSSFNRWVEAAEAMAEHESTNATAQLTDFLNLIYSAFEENAGTFLDNEGVGLYKNQSAINHSCIPNAQVVFSGSNSELQIVAIMAIETGTEVTISYLDECILKRGLRKRRKYLAEHYLFLCECSRCLAEISLPEEEEEEESQPSSEDEFSYCEEDMQA